MSKYQLDKRQSKARRAARTKIAIRNSHKKRLVVFRSLKHIYAQIIESTEKGDIVLVSSSTVDKELVGKLKGTKKDRAHQVGKLIGERAEKLVKEVAFDRNGFRYHGCVKSLAEGAREAGLVF